MARRNFNKYASIIAIIISITGLIFLTIKADNHLSLSKIAIFIGGAALGALFSLIIFRLFSRNPKSTVFLIHNFQDKDVADKISLKLEDNQIKVIDEDDLYNYGDNIIKINQKAIRNSDIIIWLLSNSSKNDKLIKQFILESKSHSKRIVPVITEKIDHLPNSVTPYKMVDISENFDEGAQKLVDKILEKSR